VTTSAGLLLVIDCLAQPDGYAHGSHLVTNAFIFLIVTVAWLGLHLNTP
jgi:hypothetical protein